MLNTLKWSLTIAHERGRWGRNKTPDPQSWEPNAPEKVSGLVEQWGSIWRVSQHHRICAGC